MHGWAHFFSVFGVVFVAELPDKTALAALVLATRHRPLPVLVGAGVALTIQSVVAVAAGHLLSLLPPRPVHLFAGALFPFLVGWLSTQTTLGNAIAVFAVMAYIVFFIAAFALPETRGRILHADA